MEPFECVLCNTLILGEWGHNPDPVSKHGQCCDSCNREFVIPMRLVHIFCDVDESSLRTIWPPEE